MNFILTSESYDLFEIGLYIPLSSYVNAIERLMYVEEKLVQVSETYDVLPPDDHPEYQYRFEQQFQKATRFLRYLEIRKNICTELVQRSRELSEQIQQ